MELFDADWIRAAETALASLPAVEGADLTIDHVVSGAPGGKVTIATTLEAGKVTEMRIGKSVDPDIVVSLKYDAAVDLLTGELGSDAGYMNGQLKVEGAHARWMLDLRPTRVAAAEVLAPVMADTAL